MIQTSLFLKSMWGFMDFKHYDTKQMTKYGISIFKGDSVKNLQETLHFHKMQFY